MRSSYLTSGKALPAKRTRAKNGSADIHSRLADFASKLRGADSTPQPTAAATPAHDDNDWECDLHFIKNCGSCRDTFGQDDEGDDEGWMAAKLVFAKGSGVPAYEPKVEDYVVIDPLEEKDAAAAGERLVFSVVGFFGAGEGGRGRIDLLRTLTSDPSPQQKDGTPSAPVVDRATTQTRAVGLLERQGAASVVEARGLVPPVIQGRAGVPGQGGPEEAIA
ncbi:hypothetical protein BDK51DRAFT_43302 [Blyttiomyces helicus]|uniref:Uncharacterized protein n=1 Tax=Blyttiomyces helicus TaxID=388810 RepID=A0A4P9WEW4_9FUNG|nr:hypothetical protein BDK51DRAFT_43302 [Blyttiomyces helicus]|eukprot:RKO90942.1 hypothetical protein BDK51DRAFT_43302 [Blyttiomyces helicus]